MKVVNPDYYVLSNEASPIEPRTYRNYYKKTLKKLGIPELKFHGMRHRFAMRCIESKNSVKTVSLILGHSNITTTMNLYVHPDNKEKKRCIERTLEDIL
jgi:integrase